MRKTLSSVCALVMTCIVASEALAQTPQKLKGIWIIDAKETAEVMKKTPPPREPGYVALMVGFWFQSMLEFDDEGVTLSAYTGAKSLRYRLVPSGGEKTEYMLENPQDGGNEILSISFLEESMHIRSSKPTFIELCAWQRGVYMDPKARFAAAKQAIEAWQAAMQSVAAVWEPKPAADKGGSR